jgi:DnaJ-domain-containing protein 1
MNGQFQVDRGSCATTPEGYDAIPEIESNRQRHVWGFVDEFQQLLGEDSEPDIRFFVESWTSGSAAAVENFQQRQQRPPEREGPKDVFCESDDLDTVSFAQERALYTEIAASALVSVNAERSCAVRSQQSQEDAAAQTKDEAWREWESIAEERDGGSGTIHPMTKQLACRLLGVTAASTRKQIKAAYRRMVSQWHPDRLEFRTEEVRRLATERMAAINEAYHLLLSGLR